MSLYFLSMWAPCVKLMWSRLEPGLRDREPLFPSHLFQYPSCPRLWLFPGWSAAHRSRGHLTSPRTNRSSASCAMQHSGTVPAVLAALPGNLPVWVVKCVHYAMYYHLCRARWSSKVQRSVIHCQPTRVAWDGCVHLSGSVFGKECRAAKVNYSHASLFFGESGTSTCCWVLHLSAVIVIVCRSTGGAGIRCVSLPCLCMKAHVYARQRCSALLFCLPIPCSFSMSEPEVEKTWNEILKAATFKMPCCFVGVFFSSLH